MPLNATNFSSLLVSGRKSEPSIREESTYYTRKSLRERTEKILKKNTSTRTVRIGEMTVELFNIPLLVETPIVNTDLLENQRIIDDALKKQGLTRADLPREQLADIYYPFFNRKATDEDDK